MRRFLVVLSVGFIVGFLATISSVGKTVKNQTLVDIPLITTSPVASGEIPITKEQPLDSSSGLPFGVGQFCGGIGNISCPSGLVCRKEQEDSGFCQPR